METLNKSLYSIRRKNSINHFFTPSDDVRKVMKPEIVRKALVEHGILEHHLDEITTVICSGAWNVFAILVLIKVPHKIVTFINNYSFQCGSIDAKLPFGFETLQDILEDSIIAEEFQERQWGFAAPFFASSIFVSCHGNLSYLFLETTN